MSGASTFDRAVALFGTTLDGPARGQIVERIAAEGRLGDALGRLRDAMRVNVFKPAAGTIDLDEIVRALDNRTREEGIHVLHDWDGKAAKITDHTFAVDVVNFVLAERGAEPVDRRVLAILLDYYFLYLLALLSLRAWDAGSADQNFDDLNRLVEHLQGSNGGGQRFTDDGETLLLIATSHYEANEQGYAQLLARVKTLNRPHQVAVALGHAGCLGSHLRYGYEATYARDLMLMRQDNVADYPWVCYAAATLMREYARLHGEDVRGPARDRVVEGLLNALSFDPMSFVGGDPPAALADHEADRRELADEFERHRQELLEEFAPYRPTSTTYSALSFFCNFSQNALKGMVVDSLLWGETWPLTLNDLMTALPRDEARSEVKTRLAKALTGYASAHPDIVRGRRTPAIVYDPATGRRAFAMAMRELKA